MTKATKYVVLAAGLIGLIAFFMPLISVSKAGITGKLSAYRIIKGIDSAKDVVGKAGKGWNAEGEKAAVAEANKALSVIRGIVLAVFSPAFFLLVFGGVGALRKSFGRGLAIPSFIIALLGLGIASLLTAAASADGGGSVAGSGLYLLVVSCLTGALGALVAIIKPDRKVAPALEHQFANSHI